MSRFKTKMSYEHRSNVGQNRGSFPWMIILIIIVFIALIYFIFPSFFPRLFTTIANPFWTLERNIIEPDTIISNNFKNEIIENLQRENTELKQLLGRNASSTITIGYILKKPPFSAYDVYIIDLGSNDGITIGEKVYVLGDILVGEIGEVNRTTSKVKLYSSFGEKYDVFIGKNNIEATALGRGGGSFEITIPRDIKISQGDKVVSPNISGSTFGIVDKTITDPAKAFSKILFAQPINIYEQKFVIIKR